MFIFKLKRARGVTMRGLLDNHTLWLVVAATAAVTGQALAAGEAPPTIVAHLRDHFVGHRTLDATIRVELHMDEASGGDDIQSMVLIQSEDGQVASRTRFGGDDGAIVGVSAGWDGDRAWRVDRPSGILTSWAAPLAGQPGVTVNPLYLAGSLLLDDFGSPGVLVPASDVSDPAKWEAALSRAQPLPDGRVRVSLSEAAHASLRAAAATGDRGAALLQGGWFELTPAQEEGFPLKTMTLVSAGGEPVTQIEFNGSVASAEGGTIRVWPACVSITPQVAGRVGPVTEFQVLELNHPPLGEVNCSPDVSDVRLVVDGDIPYEPS